MVVRNWTTVEGIEAALNRKPPSPAAYARFLKKLLEGTGQLNDAARTALQDWVERVNRGIKKRRDLFLQNYLAKAPTTHDPAQTKREGWALPDNISRDESMPFREALISARLRTYVDAWLETGRHPDGSESPSGRDLRKAPEAWRAFLEYMEKAPPRLRPSSSTDGLELIAFVAERTAYTGNVRSLFESMRVEAQRLLFGLMTSDWKDRLCKCRYQYCGQYFLHPRPRKCYRRGTFCCRGHAASAAADHSMRRARVSGLQTLLDAAARKLCAWRIEDSGWRDNVAIKQRLSSELSFVIARRRLQSYHEEVRVNWVTRHQETIERKRCEFAEACIVEASW
jgi:hypothetical protein